MKKGAASSAKEGSTHYGLQLSEDTLHSEDLQASPEFVELCESQLALLPHVVRSAGLRVSVYARAPSSFETGQLLLRRVAAAGGAGGAAGEGTLHLGAGAGAEAEASLVHEQIVVLPDSGGLVLALVAHARFLVGLLVVEKAVGSAAASAAPGAKGGALGGGSSEAGQAMALASLDVGQYFSVAEVGALRKVATVLALAGAMDLRAVLERAAEAGRRQFVRGLVDEARGPLSALRTLGAMLAPRTREGFESDMAAGIVVQGQRLQEVVTALQAALHPVASPRSFAPAAAPAGERCRVADVVEELLRDLAPTRSNA
ncbi:hypothetical protein WJX81_005814 [Elliptochloris bilobata]|uniref:Uncharacterized protein n=1 Tax=Elliptochloris bilobata TaxID=381761 RepID=A0AAW1S8W7_9CHLO